VKDSSQTVMVKTVEDDLTTVYTFSTSRKCHWQQSWRRLHHFL